MKTPAIIVLILVVIAILAGVYFFTTHTAVAPVTSTSTPITASSTVSSGNPTSSTSPSYYTDVSAWQTSVETNIGNGAGFSIAYPLDFIVNENNSATADTDWRLNTMDPGMKIITITVPKAFEPQTNFVDATLTVGYSKAAHAVANCFTADPSGGPSTATSTVTINGTTFVVFTSSDAGAGNIYKTTSYRTTHADACYAVEYTVHSAELGNFPPAYDLKQYSDAMIDQVLNRIVSTFKFL